MKVSDSSTGSTSFACSGILRRLLCGGCTTLPTQTHPTVPDHSEIHNHHPQHHFITKPNHHDVKASSPGVVARLMGLESFPDHTPAHTTLGALLRSRSVNSIDFLVHFDSGLPHHRRVRTAISFPQGLDDDVKCQKRQKGEIFREKTGAAKRVEVTGEVRNRFTKKDFLRTRPQVKKLPDRNSMRVKKRKNKTKVHPQAARRRVRSKQPPVLSENGIFQGACEKKVNKGDDDEGRARMVEEICRVTEEDVKENWDPKFEDFEGEICQQFGQEILHALMKQLIDELDSFS